MTIGTLRMLLALFYYESSQLDKALTAYKDLLANSPNNSRILQTIGAIQFSLVDYDSARRTFEKALQLDANSSNYANLATVYFYQKNYQEAVTNFQKAVELKPERYLLWETWQIVIVGLNKNRKHKTLTQWPCNY